ncbi:hypothetical protein PtA15_7A291 [Puccinia triticina]|uniref:CBM21 domain-containing protein n=1 Tax=Puccinia triticina TaxID=208348 RepID=A0ABY7CPG7_9BASI|nr:uncharacterized protein PtA15_7A291 [Puccinia triticina]WAQ86565.1 hypothetical protein PtA15_7A291 [Puccinia triticina]
MFSLQPPPEQPSPPSSTPSHCKSYSDYQFPTVHFNAPTPPTAAERTADYFAKPTRPLHQKAQSESLMRLQLPHSPTASLDNIPMLRKNSYANLPSRSAPSTPTQQAGPKAVHFDAHLEHVRHFLSQQRPIAVSRDGSPIETETEGEEEYPFPPMATVQQPPPTKLVIELPNMPLQPRLSPAHKLCLSTLELAPDAKTLKGTVLVENISFEKRVAVRFTFDAWQTVSELQDVLARINERQMEVAVRYRANGHEFWDNNGGANYRGEPCAWAVTLRAELDRLVGDDLGIPPPVGLPRKKPHHQHAASFSGASRLDALVAGAQLRNGAGLSARYDFGLSLKQAASTGAHKPARFVPMVPTPTRTSVPSEWIGLASSPSPAAFLDTLANPSPAAKRWSTGRQPDPAFAALARQDTRCPRQSPPPFACFASGLVTPQSPSLTDESG